MSDTPDKLILALLREIGADTAAIRHVQEKHGVLLIALQAGRREAVDFALAHL